MNLTKTIMTKGYILTCMMLAIPCVELYAQQGDEPKHVLKKDTAEVEDNPYAIIRDPSVVRTDSARLRGDIDPIRYRMDHRYQGVNEKATHHWYDNMFLTLGAGTMMVIPSSDDYRLNPITNGQLGVGVQLGRYHSLRGVVFAGLGYQQKYDRMYGRVGGMAEHLFDLSSFLEGYKPTRLLGVSTLVGVGMQKAKLNKLNGRFSPAKEMHAGLQLHFYTGPHGYLTLEPYLGLASDQMDLSQQRNWRRFDVFYGVTANYVYYFTNHLSREARQRQIQAARQHGRQHFVAADDRQDSILQSWQTPWIFEMAFGPNVSDNDKLSVMETMGPSVNISVGKWFSPVIGIRGTLASRTSTWVNEPVIVDDIHITRHRNMRYVSGGLEAMLNPLGLSQHFSWNSPYGAYLLAGGEYGWLVKEQDGGSLRCRSEAYTAGLHLWMRLSDGIRVFLEPRLMHNVYKIPYKNVKWNHRFSDNSYALRIGLTAQSVSKYFRKPSVTDAHDGEWHPLTVGIGAGTSSLQAIRVLDENGGLSYNIHGHATYHVSKTSGIRLGLEYLTLTASEKTRFTDYNMAAAEIGYAPIKREGLWNHHYHVGAASLAYVLNMTNLMGGYQPGRLFHVEAFFGPAVVSLFGESGELNERIYLAQGHEARVDNQVKTKTIFALNGGAVLTARLSSRLSVALMHQLYWINKLSFPAIMQSTPHAIETFDLGVQYGF